jgi:transposase
MTHDHLLGRELMIRIKLSPEQRVALIKARRVQTSNLAERCLVVMLADQGQRVPSIAKFTGRHEHTIRSWLKAYLEEGIEGLKYKSPSGRTNRKERAALSILKPVLMKHPSEYGYLEVGWNTNLLVAFR